MHTHKAFTLGSHSFTCKQHHACLSFVRVHQMAPPQLRQQASNCSLRLTYRPRKNEMLSWPGWLTYGGWFTHVSGHPSAAGRAQDKESSPAEDRRYTVVPRDQLYQFSDRDKTFCSETETFTKTQVSRRETSRDI